MRGDRIVGLLAATAGMVLAAGAASTPAAPVSSSPDSVVGRIRSDTTYSLAPIVVRAARIGPQAVLDRLPGEATSIDLAPHRDRLTTTAEILEQVPGLHVAGTGGSFSSASIRGSDASQVSVYLDGVPLSHTGLGVVDLADLPFAGLDRVEVYRGFAPPELAGASLGGAINLVTRLPQPGGPRQRHSTVVLGAGSFGTSRIGISQEFSGGAWSGLAIFDHRETRGDFDYLDDGGTPLNPTDDAVVQRGNNWQRADELLVRVGRTLSSGELRLLDQWVRRDGGVPGIASQTSARARRGAEWNLASAEARFPGLASGRVGLLGRVYYQWRRDRFSDPDEIGLGYQDNRDDTHTYGVHTGLQFRLPVVQRLGFDVEARRERLDPTRRYPLEERGPERVRTVLEAALEERWVIGPLGLHAGLRSSRRTDDFPGHALTVYSRVPAISGTDVRTEPRLGFRLQVWRGLSARGSWGRYHRDPSFLELFYDGGSTSGRSNLVPEHGTNRDLGLTWNSDRGPLDLRLATSHFDNRVDDPILFLPAGTVFVVSNIGAARVRGEEVSWHAAASRSRPRWRLEGNFTRLDARDLGVDRSWYAGKTLPGRPARELWQRLEVRLGPVDLGYEYRHVGQNFLDRYNLQVVERRDVHSIDARIAARGAGLRFELRNLGNERTADILGFPLPGRALFMTASYKL